MIKLMLLLARKEGLDIEAFQRELREGHGPLVARTPGLAGCVQSHAIPEVYEKYPPAFDGLEELWFDSLGALEAAEASAAFREAEAQLGDIASRVARTVTSEVPIIDALPDPRERQSMVKFVGLLTRVPGLSVEEFQRRWRDVHGPLVHEEFPEMRRYIQSHALPETYGTARSPAFDGSPLAWFDSLDVFPWRMVRREGEERNTPAARDSAATFVQPIPSLVTREVVIV